MAKILALKNIYKLYYVRKIVFSPKTWENVWIIEDLWLFLKSGALAPG